MKNGLELIESEAKRATKKHGGFNSLHEAYAVLLEEVDEFWDQVKLKKSLRDKTNIATELVQIAAVCLKTLESFDLIEHHPEAY